MDQYYKYPTQASPLTLITATLLAIPFAVSWALIYHTAQTFMSIVYFNLVFAALCGAGLGYSAIFIARLTKVRTPSNLFTLTLFISLTAFAMQWMYYVAHIAIGEFDLAVYFELLPVMLSQPDLLTEVLSYCYYEGAWTLLGGRVTGWILGLIWVSEACLLVGLPFYILRHNPQGPFSEKLNKWYPRYQLRSTFEKISVPQQFTRTMEVDAEQAISALGLGSAFRFSVVYVYFLPQEEMQYLSVVNVFEENRGSGKTQQETIVSLLAIRSSAADSMMKKWGARKRPFIG